MTDFKIGLKVVTTTLFVGVLCLFVFISFDVMLNAVSTKVIGYDVYEVTEDKKVGEKIGFVETVPEEKEENVTYISVYSEKPQAAKIAEWTFQLVCGLCIFFCTAGSIIAKAAARDRNDVDFNKGVHDRFRGFKIGLFAGIPSAVAYVLTIVAKFCSSSIVAQGYYTVYRWVLTSPVKPLVDLLANNAVGIKNTDMKGILLAGIFVPLMVLFCGVMYFICYNEDSIVAKVLYKSAQKIDKTRKVTRR